ncbi:hypothetical protein HPB48_000733 [Haemaphysalis longicornis]|uniref:Uncharacterized protein n=1 Tax=Haemaphysalis longicornis TaxID=44386 RepID=A0A9J6H079_HAELO|nr:hypothetical protein HPB48_000733 [Haemaphysalis longicornis]
MFTWSVLEFLPLKICDFFLIRKFTPRAGLAGNIQVRKLLVHPPTILDDTTETKPRDHVEAVLPTTYFSHCALCSYFSHGPIGTLGTKLRMLPTEDICHTAGCDTGLGNAIALALHNKGFTVFAGCLDVRSEGARKLMSNGVTALHVDYLEHDTIVAAYDNIRDNLNALWGLVANAGVACYGETEWMLSPELEWAINVNILGTYKFIMLGINQIKRSEGRIVIITGLHGQPSYLPLLGGTFR